ncbi:MAG: hypothetical protein N3E42_05975 [Candidatus Bipolaricaulota bacterium]|nr:hypothetical protein [Candidatus Bipolaricaulota bacterium]
MNDPRNDDWSWFDKLLVPLRASSGVHPAHSVLRAYMRGHLRDLWRVRPLRPETWTLTEVSQHVLTCSACAEHLALLRRRELEHVRPWQNFWSSVPSTIRTHLAVYTLALLALFILNVFLVMVWPAPTVSLPCVLGAGVVGPYDQEVQTPVRSLKLEGLNRPAKLPDSLSGACKPAPAPRPLWQTWWISWVFFIWTLLLGMHILWDWLANPTPRRTVATSSLIRM